MNEIAVLDKEEILTALDIPNYYKNLIPSLKTNGKPEALGLCYSHPDTVPSLSINLENGRHYCHACGAKGDVFSLYQYINKVDFPTALKGVAKLAGITETEVKPKVVARYKYRNKNGDIVYVKDRLEPGRHGKSKEFRFLHDKNGEATFGRGDSESILYNLPEVIKAETIFIVEGEAKADLLSSFGLTATCQDSGASSPIKKSHLKVLRSKKRVNILPDEDKPGNDYAEKMAKLLHAYVEEVKIIKLPGLREAEDVIDWIEIPGNNKEKLLEIVENTSNKNFCTDESTTKDRESWDYNKESLSQIPSADAHPSKKIAYVNGTRAREKGKNPLARFEIKQRISNFIGSDMKAQGKFFNTDEGVIYYFQSETKILYRVSKEDKNFTLFLNKNYRINPSEAEFSYITKDLECIALITGEKVPVRRYAYLDVVNKVLYVANNASEMYKLDGRTITLLPNGSDNVFFVPDTNLDHITYNPHHKKLLDDLIINPINFSHDEAVNLTPDEQKFVFKIWLYTLFFESLQPTKIIQVFIGEKGSGKTSQQRKTGILLFGKEFNVIPISKEDDFDATISGNYVVAFDNADGNNEWLCDRLAHSSTGKTIQKRELYTTNTMVKFKPRCFLSLNARTPKFKRDDVVDRLLLFKVQRLENFESEHSIIEGILKNRNDLVSELFDNLNLIIKHMQGTHKPFVSNHRMADFVSLGWQIASAGGCGDLFLSLMEKCGEEQDSFLMEDNPIFNCLNLWLNNGNEGKTVTTYELFCAFQDMEINKKVSFTFKSTKSFGINLKNMISNLSKFFDIKIGKNSVLNVATYTFYQK